MPAPPTQEILVIMARHPEAGAVKRRLARDLGADRTLLVYRAFLEDLEGKFGLRRRPRVWYYTPPASPFEALFGGKADCREQSGENLQERLRGVFDALFGEGYRRVAAMGTDCPHLAAEQVDAAFEGLRQHDVVLVPSDDGGYNLIGLRCPADLFTGVALGTDAALRETVDRARSLGLSCCCLPPSFDVDTIDDLRRLQAFLSKTDDPLPRTREALARIFGDRRQGGRGLKRKSP
ncbi:MAG: TIGR04282 family arsenosugar biosynthesis glycosyltransferase [Syntrophobacterales bacterium]|nr:TIGR04282 family arsenosugar biosynthesis glycosyltransferase [Syntrophobacterales bacterium]